MQKKEKIWKKSFKIQFFFDFSDIYSMKNKTKTALYLEKAFIASLLAAISLLVFSCKSLPQEAEKKELSRQLLGQGQLSAGQLAGFFLSRNPDADAAHIQSFAQFYIDEAAAEGINSDVVFAQMCLETGFLRFGGLVQPEFHNYCGLGAMDADHPGEIFETEELGVRAHIQHLQAYATKEETQLHKELVDPRYNWVHKTKYIDDIFGLTGTWATDPHYGEKIDNLITAMEDFIQ